MQKLMKQQPGNVCGEHHLYIVYGVHILTFKLTFVCVA